MISPFAAVCVPERTLQNRVTGHHDNDDMYMTFATHVFNKYNTYLPLVYNWLDAHSVLTQCLTHHGSPVRTGIQKHVTHYGA